jgi:hypothetical protein
MEQSYTRYSLKIIVATNSNWFTIFYFVYPISMNEIYVFLQNEYYYWNTCFSILKILLLILYQ